MDDPQLWDAIVEMNRQGLLIASLLGGFTMATAFQAFSEPWKNKVHMCSSFAALISSISLICWVFISAFVVFSFSDYEYRQLLYTKGQIGLNLLTPSSYFLKLSVVGLLAGSVGIVSLFLMFALLGWERNIVFGIITTLISLSAFFLLAYIFFYVYTNIVKDYGDLGRMLFERE